MTSSNPVAGGACTGGGIGPLQVDEVIGVMKAYSTRVGSGPYPTELHDEIGAGIASRGHEFGTVTGRPRRVGWFDAVPLRYAVAVNSVSSIMLNKLDILSGIETIRLCVAYELDGRRVETWPSSGAALSRATPIYDEFDGLAGADQRHPLARRPARERAALPVGDRGARRRPDRARVGRSGADPDDRARLAADAQPGGAAGMSLVMPTRIVIVGVAGASMHLPGSWPPSRASTRSSWRRGVTRSRANRVSDACRASIRSIRLRSSRSPGARPRSWSSSAPRRHWRPVSPMR